MNFKQLRKEIIENAMKEDDYEITYRLDPNPIIEYTLHKIDNFEYEILDKEVTFNDNQCLSCDWDTLSCWEVLDMNGFVEDNFNIEVGDTLTFTLQLRFTYTTDYFGEVDCDWDFDIIE